LRQLLRQLGSGVIALDRPRSIVAERELVGSHAEQRLSPMRRELPEEVRTSLWRLLTAVRESDMSITSDVILDLELGGFLLILLRTTAQQSGVKSLLSPRQREIAKMVAEGRTNKSIAHALGISEWTVNSHLRRLYAKTGVNSRAQLVAKIVRWDPILGPPHEGMGI
jgi:DNA-binding CsgD family transcriptional regulator